MSSSFEEYFVHCKLLSLIYWKELAINNIILQSLVSDKLGEFMLPTQISNELYTAILNLTTSNETDLIKKHYALDKITGIYQLQTEFR